MVSRKCVTYERRAIVNEPEPECLIGFWDILYVHRQIFSPHSIDFMINETK